MLIIISSWNSLPAWAWHNTILGLILILHPPFFLSTSLLSLSIVVQGEYKSRISRRKRSIKKKFIVSIEIHLNIICTQKEGTDIYILWYEGKCGNKFFLESQSDVTENCRHKQGDKTIETIENILYKGIWNLEGVDYINLKVIFDGRINLGAEDFPHASQIVLHWPEPIVIFARDPPCWLWLLSWFHFRKNLKGEDVIDLWGCMLEKC